jgi:hypothetical protein
MSYKLPEIAEGEQLIWTSQPETYKDYRIADRILLPLSGVMLAFGTLFGAYTIYSMLCYGFQAYHALSLVLIALIMAAGVYTFFFRFMVKRSNKRRLVYGLTSMGRVLIRDMKTLDIVDYTSDDLEEAYITDMDKNGTGTIYLGEEHHFFDNTGLNFFAGSDSNFVALYDVADCEKVLDMILGN